MFRKINVFLILAVFILVTGNLVFCASASSESGILAKAKETIIDGWKIKSNLNLLAGCDDNVHLDSQRRASAFFETYWKVDFAKDLNDSLKASFDYKFLNLVFTDVGKATFYKNTIEGGLASKNLGRFTLYADIGFNYFDYPHEAEDDNYESTAVLGIEDKICKGLYQKVEYEFLFKDYMHVVVRNANYVLEDTEKKRKDLRNAITYEIGKYFSKSLYKLYFNYFQNESNMAYLDYYDYDSYKIGTSLTYLFTKKFSGYTSFAYVWRNYKDRGTIADPTIHADDKEYVTNISLFYKLTEKASLGAGYTYRQNESAEPLQDYSGSVITCGVYYRW